MNVSEMNTKNEIMAEYARLKSTAERKRINLPEELAGLNKNYTKAEFLEAAEGIDRLLAGQAESDGEQMSLNVGHSAKRTMQKSPEHEDSIAKEEQRIEAADWTEAKKTGRTAKVRADASDMGLDMLAPEIIEKIRAMESIKEERMQELNSLIRLEDRLNELAIMTNNRRETYFSRIRKQQESLEKNASENAAALESIQESNKQKIEEMQTRLDNMKKDMEQALKEPKWSLYLGRKCCVPSRPVLDGSIREFATIDQAVSEVSYAERADATIMLEIETDSVDLTGTSLQRPDELGEGYRAFVNRNVIRKTIQRGEGNVSQ